MSYKSKSKTDSGAGDPQFIGRNQIGCKDTTIKAKFNSYNVKPCQEGYKERSMAQL